ncbi:MAG: hypothetical protein FWC15_08680 [Fibromonadales bacterium]|nr:hypothetical protein [Fibromonadales bacterium]
MRTVEISKAPKRRPWLGVISHCCGVYSRAYLSVHGEWTGHCSRCARRIVVL